MHSSKIDEAQASTGPPDFRRGGVFFVASASAAISTLALVVLFGAKVSDCWWEVSSALLCLLAGVCARSPSKFPRFLSSSLLVVFLVSLTPVLVVLRGGRADLVLMFAVPLAISLTFIDRVRVVTLVSVMGFVVNTATMAYLAWPALDVARAVMLMLSLYGAGIVSSASFSTMRRIQRRNEQALVAAASAQTQSERLAHIGLLAAGVAHEINNPLSYIAANLTFLEAGDPLRDEAERSEAWRDVQHGLTQIAAIVTDLKGLARDESKGVAAVDVRQVLERVARLVQLRASSQVLVSVDAPPTPLLAMSDEMRLTQALTNMVVNSCDALEGLSKHVGHITLRAARVDGMVQLDIEDNGPGVPEAAKAMLFTPFFTTKPVGKGTGLGLSLSRQYVESFGGELTLQPSVTGAHFRIVLRAAEPRRVQPR